MPYVDSSRTYLKKQPRVPFLDSRVVIPSGMSPKKAAIYRKKHAAEAQQFNAGTNHNKCPSWEWSVDGVICPVIHEEIYPAAERTLSYRTGTTLSAAVDHAMTGPEIEEHIRHGDVLDIDLDAPGGIIDTGENVRFGEDINAYDRGHEFRTTKFWRMFSTFVDVPRFRDNHLLRYKGPIWCLRPGEQLWPSVPFDTSTSDLGRLHALGNRAIAQSAPTRPEAQLGQFIEQLYMLPSLPFLRMLKGRGPGNPGSEYLNVVFGWKPLLGDIQTLALAITDSDKLVRQMRDQMSKMYHRKVFLVDQERTTTVTPCDLQFDAPPVYEPQYRTLGSVCPTTGPNSVQLDQKIESVYFVGLFSFYFQEMESFLGKLTAYMSLAQQLLGGELTLDQLWEVTPWSWLIDWFTDTQEFFARLSRLSEDSLVLRYGYVMRSLLATRTYMSPNITSFDGTVIPTPQSSYSAYKVERVRSTPYGFGVDLTGMTPARWAILAALGFTLAPGILRSL